MNERIRELMAEADRKCSETRGIYDEILAELIVRECASKVDWIYAEKGITIDGVNFTVTQGDLIKQHFGVEE